MQSILGNLKKKKNIEFKTSSVSSAIYDNYICILMLQIHIKKYS